MTTGTSEILRIVTGDHSDPFSVLGMHRLEQGIVVRAFHPGADRVSVVAAEGARYSLQRVHPDGFFEGTIEDRDDPFRYDLEIEHGSAGGAVQRTRGPDPYSFPARLSDFDLYLLGEGTNLQVYETLGAHLVEMQGVTGVGFAVWAPNARRVSVVGDFNQWDGRRDCLRNRGASGVWELFLPGLAAGSRYKYEIVTPANAVTLKSDPFGRQMELRPENCSVVAAELSYPWSDEEWISRRDSTDHRRAPISVYEVHLDSWRADLANYRELAEELVPYVLDMGFTHIELLPVMEHPLDESWGYQVVGYFAPTSRHGDPRDFQYFVDHCHRHGIGVILDWVPAHFPVDQHGLAQFDGTALFEHADPRQGSHPDWGTSIFNFGRNEVRNFLCSNALFWFDKYHIDGLRVDAVASMLFLDYSRAAGEWVPNRFGGRENLEAISFLRFLNETVYARHPGALMIAEESTSWPMVSMPVDAGGLGFGFKWNMGWMNDSLQYISKDPVHRRFHHHILTFGLIYAFSENFILSLSHDEVVHGKGSLLDKMPGDRWQKLANLRLLLGYMCSYPGKKLLFMGAEIGQRHEWNHKSSLPWELLEEPAHLQIQTFTRDLNRLYRTEPALHDSDCDSRGFEWIDFQDTDQSVICYIRRSIAGAPSVCFVCNFTPVPHTGYHIGVPTGGHYREVLNSDAEIYGGSNMGNGDGVTASSSPHQGRECSLLITLPPLSIVGFQVPQ